MRYIKYRYHGFEKLTGEHWHIDSYVLVVSKRVVMSYQGETLVIEKLGYDIDDEAQLLEVHYDDDNRFSLEYELPSSFIRNIDLMDLAKMSVTEMSILILKHY